MARPTVKKYKINFIASRKQKREARRKMIPLELMNNDTRIQEKYKEDDSKAA